MKIIRLSILLLVAVGVIVVSITNRDVVTFKLVPGQYELDAPLYLILLTIFLVGLVCGGLAASAARMRRWKKKRQKARKLIPDSGEAVASSSLLTARRRFPISLKLRDKTDIKEDL